MTQGGASSSATMNTLTQIELNSDDEDEKEVLSEREKNADRLVQAAIFGLAFGPWKCSMLAGSLLKVYISSEKLEGRPLKNAWVGGGIALASYDTFTDLHEFHALFLTRIQSIMPAHTPHQKAHRHLSRRDDVLAKPSSAMSGLARSSTIPMASRCCRVPSFRSKSPPRRHRLSADGS